MKPPTLESARVRKIDKVPPGWFTRSQLEREWNLGQAQTLVLLRTAVQAKRADVKTFCIPAGMRSYMPVPHYRFKQAI